MGGLLERAVVSRRGGQRPLEDALILVEFHCGFLFLISFCRLFLLSPPSLGSSFSSSFFSFLLFCRLYLVCEFFLSPFSNPYFFSFFVFSVFLSSVQIDFLFTRIDFSSLFFVFLFLSSSLQYYCLFFIGYFPQFLSIKDHSPIACWFEQFSSLIWRHAVKF